MKTLGLMVVLLALCAWPSHCDLLSANRPLDEAITENSWVIQATLGSTKTMEKEAPENKKPILAHVMNTYRFDVNHILKQGHDLGGLAVKEGGVIEIEQGFDWPIKLISPTVGKSCVIVISPIKTIEEQSTWYLESVLPAITPAIAPSNDAMTFKSNLANALLEAIHSQSDRQQAIALIRVVYPLLDPVEQSPMMQKMVEGLKKRGLQ